MALTMKMAHRRSRAVGRPLERKFVMSRLLAKNEHSVERGMRVVLGLGLLTLTFMGPHTALGYVGLIPLATGLLGSCPLYSLLGFSTCRVPVNKGAKP